MVRNWGAEFKTFLLRGNIVALAVAFVIGAAFKDVVTSMVESLFTPLIAAIFGEPDFARLTFTINDSVFQYGAFVNALIAFLAIAAVVFFFVVKPVNAMIARAKEEPPADPSNRKCPECLSEIPLAASRCAFCAAESAAEAA